MRPPSAFLTCAVLTAISATAYVPRYGFPEQHRLLSSRQTPLANNTKPAILDVFEVDPPVRFLDTPYSSSAPHLSAPGLQGACSQLLVQYSFQNSYGQPSIGSFIPPACSFNRATWNLTVTSSGRQFDRLGTVSFGDVEIFRTSTAEPTRDGIVWTYIKDVSPFVSLFKAPQKIIFDLGNIIDSTYTGPFNVTLTAAYYNVSYETTHADVILPLSRRASAQNSSSVFNYPDQNATDSFAIPANASKAIFTIAATGQSNEEFWWSNVLEQDVNAFPQSGQLLGLSPFREVQLFIDGQLAGVAWPFPVIFTGGIVPGFWRPIVGIDAFDLKEDEIDITPWLPLLRDGKDHEFTVKVSGLDVTADGTTVLAETTNEYWLITGKVFIWTSTKADTTAESAPILSLPGPTISTSSVLNPGTNGTTSSLDYSLSVSRKVSISTSSDSTTASWTQSLTFTSTGTLFNGGNNQVTALLTTGHDTSSSGYSHEFSYPLNVTSAYAQLSSGISINGTFSRGKDVTTSGPCVFPKWLESYGYPDSGPVGAHLATTQTGSASYTSNTTAGTSSSFGTTAQVLQLDAVPVGGYGKATDLYYRSVEAVNSTIAYDIVRDAGRDGAQAARQAGKGGQQGGQVHVFAVPRVAGKKQPPVADGEA